MSPQAGASEGVEGEEGEESQQLPGEIVAHWKPNITIALVQDFTSYPDAQIPPQARELAPVLLRCNNARQSIGNGVPLLLTIIILLLHMWCVDPGAPCY